MKVHVRNQTLAAAVVSALVASLALAVELPTRFTNLGGVINSRHNLTQRAPAGTVSAISPIMDSARNNYAEVCVYCHTPHTANITLDAPLWNRTRLLGTVYQTYDLLGTSSLTQPVIQPGAQSLTCLSCHDGTIAVDSIINMPGSGQTNIAAMTTHQEAFLDAWAPDAAHTAAGATTSPTHSGIGTTAPGGGGGCQAACHNDALGIGTSFQAFLIGTDLRNDHPVGITLPTSGPAVSEFNAPGATVGTTRYYDVNPANGRLDKGEIRFYANANGPAVECASCHDPHGVPASGPGTQFAPTFLRVTNVGSTVCLTCHNK